MATILIVDDEKNIREHLAIYVRSLRHRAEVAPDATEALALLERHDPDVIFSDVRMAGMDGLALLREIRRRRPDAVVVLMTAYATVAEAVEAMRAGAYDYLVKPFSLDQVGLLLARVLEVQALRRENRALRRVLDEPAVLESASPAMARALATARQAAASDATLLLTGESGTGKNVLAAAMHAWSPRHAGPFVTISCTSLAEHLLESELFGHMKGAFTSAWKDKPGRLEAARGGTIFLDEVGDLPPELQGKLLRFLEEHRFERVGGSETIEVDARVVAATRRDRDDGGRPLPRGRRAPPHRAGARRVVHAGGGRRPPRHQRDDALAQAQAVRDRVAPAPKTCERTAHATRHLHFPGHDAARRARLRRRGRRPEPRLRAPPRRAR